MRRQNQATQFSYLICLNEWHDWWWPQHHQHAILSEYFALELLVCLPFFARRVYMRCEVHEISAASDPPNHHVTNNISARQRGQPYGWKPYSSWGVTKGKLDRYRYLPIPSVSTVQGNFEFIHDDTVQAVTNVSHNLFRCSTPSSREADLIEFAASFLN